MDALVGSALFGNDGGLIENFAVPNLRNIVGSPFDDFLSGTQVPNLIEGLAGDDEILGKGGDDTLIGGLGDDTIDGGEGNDRIQIVAIDETDGVNRISVDGGAGVNDVLDLSALSQYAIDRTSGDENAGVYRVRTQGTDTTVAEITYSNIEVTIGTVTLNLNGFETLSGNEVNPITLDQISPLITEAIDLWSTAGYNVDFPTDLADIEFAIADLPGTIIGQTDGTSITLDPTAGGIGWFVDLTPADSEEFSLVNGLYQATSGPAQGKLDLLTTLTHEFGHILGLPDLYTTGTLMGSVLQTSTRLQPDPWTSDSPALGAAVTGNMTGVVSDVDLFETGLTTFATWAENYAGTIAEISVDESGEAIDIPFVAETLGNLFTQTGSEINAAIVSAIIDPVKAHLESNDLSTLDTLAGIEDAGTVGTEFTATVSLVDLAQTFDLTFDNTTLSSVGLNFRQANAPILELLAGLDIVFNFGKDTSGEFFVRNPELVVDLNLAPTTSIDPDSISGDSGGTFVATDEGLLYNPPADFQGVETVTYTVVDASGNASTLTREIVVDFDPEVTPTADFFVDRNSSDTLLNVLEESVNFTVNFGPLGVKVEDGELDYDASLSAIATGKLTVADLAADTDGSLIDDIDLDPNSTYTVALPIALETPFAGFDLPLPGFIGTFDFLNINPPTTLEGFLDNVQPFSLSLDDLNPLKDLSLEDIGNQITSAIDSTIGNALETEIPLLDKTVADILGTSSNIIEDIKGVIDDAVTAAPNLQSLSSAINDGLSDLLGITDGFGFDFDEAISVNLSFDSSSVFNLPLGLDLSEIVDSITDDLGLSNVDPDAFDFSLGALDVTAGFGVDLGLMLDFSDDADSVVSISDDSGISINLDAENTDYDLDLTLPIPGLSIGGITIDPTDFGLLIEDGEIDLGFELDVSLAPSDDGSYSLSEVSSATQSDFNGGVTVTLPTFFPTAELPLGGTTEDTNNDGFADNVFHLNAEFADGTSTREFITPTLGPSFAIGGLLQTPTLLTDQLGNVLDDLDNEVQSIFDFDIPFVGDELKNQLDFFSDLKNDLVDPLGTRLTNFTGDVSQTITEIETQINNIIEGLDNLTLQNALDTLNVKGDRVEFVLDLEGTESITISPDFNAGFPGLNLDIDADVTLDFNYGFLLGFGFHFRDGFYLVTDSDLNSGREVFIEVEATIADGSSAEGTLGFLNLSLTEEADGVDSGLRASIGLDISDPGGDGRLDISEFSAFEIRPIFDGDLNTKFDFEANIPEFDLFGQTFEFPALSADLDILQGFGSIEDLVSDILGDAVFFDNITLDLGAFISTFMDPIVEFVTDTLEPIEPVIDLLTTEIGFLKQLGLADPTLLGLAALSGGAVADASRAINAIVETFEFSRTIKDLGNDIAGTPLQLNIGSFFAGGVGSGGRGSGSVTGSSAISGTAGVQSGAAGSLNSSQQTKLNNTLTKVGPSVGTGNFRIQFDLLTNPSNAFNLLLGQEANLFTLNLPPLSLIFEYIQSFSIFPGLNARLGGRVTATTNFGFGFDTKGIIDWADNFDYEPLQAFRVLDGFFLSDNGIEGTASDLPEARLEAAIIAGASIGAAGVAEAGVDGGVGAAISFDLRDITTPNADGELVGDGEIRWQELAQLLETGNPFCLFNTRGELVAFLEAFLSVKAGPVTIFEARQRFINEVLASFDISLCDDGMEPPQIAQFNAATGALSLATLPNGGSEARGGAPEKYLVDFDEETNEVVVSALGFFERYDADLVQSITNVTSDGNGNLLNGTDFDDVYVIAENINSTNLTNLSSITLKGGLGNDVLEVNSDIGALLEGGPAAIADRDTDDDVFDLDTIIGGQGNDTILGGADADGLSGGGGNDDIQGGLGDDTIDGGAGTDTIAGGAGADIIAGGTGADSITGGSEDDTLAGGSEDDTIEGGEGNDSLSGDEGADSISGGNDNDTIDGGIDADNLAGNAGDDTFLWQAGDGVDASLVGGDDNGDTDADSTGDRFELKAFTSQIESVALEDGSIENRYVESHGDNTISIAANSTDATAVDITVDGSTFTLQDTEGLLVELGDGADKLTVNDLSSTVLEQFDISSGVTRSIAQTDPVPAFTVDFNDDGTVKVDNEGNPILVEFFEQRTVDFETGETETVRVEDIFDYTLKTVDDDEDIIKILGTSGADTFTLSSGEIVDSEAFIPLEAPDGAIVPVIQVEQTGGVTFTLREVGVTDDRLVIAAGAGDDTIDASAVAADGLWLDDLRLLGEADSDRLIGSVRNETLIGGLGADTVTGNEGIDTFTHEDHTEDDDSIDVLIETREADFFASDNVLHIGELNIDNDAKQLTSLGAGETELLANVFETVRLIGEDTGDNARDRNTFWIEDFTQRFELDGQGGVGTGLDAEGNPQEQGDLYYIVMKGQATRTDGGVYIEDSDYLDGTDEGLDIVQIIGSDTIADIFLFDVDDAGQGYVEHQTDFNDFNNFQSLNVDLLVNQIDEDGEAGLNTNSRSVSSNTTAPRVYYSAANNLEVYGLGGNDLFISDDSAFDTLPNGDARVSTVLADNALTGAGVEVYGGVGNDQFFVGNVISTEVDPTTGITFVTEITKGVGVATTFYGEAGNDYFEVNRNAAEISLKGGENDDVFYLKAHLEKNDAGEEVEVEVDNINIDGGSEDEEGASDALFSYISNDKVFIDGGEGFDTLVIAGTEIADTFYIFTGITQDENGANIPIQRLYGAGLIVEEIQDIQRLILITGAGDDTVYIYGTLPEQEILVNTGSDNDRIEFGGPERNFTVVNANGVEEAIVMPAEFDLQAIQGDVQVFGSGGDDALILNHEPDNPKDGDDPFTWTLTTDLDVAGQTVTTVRGRVADDDADNIGTIFDYQGFENVVFEFFGDVNNFVDLKAVDRNVAATFIGGGGDSDRITLDAAEEIEAIAAAIEDAAIIIPDGDDADSAPDARGNGIQVSDLGPISDVSLLGFETAEVQLGSNDDAVEVDVSVTDVQLDIRGNRGDDTIEIDNVGNFESDDLELAAVRILGGEDFDAIAFDLNGDPSQVTQFLSGLDVDVEGYIVDNSDYSGDVIWQLGNNRLSANGAGILALGNATSLDIRAGSGTNDGFILEERARAIDATINGDRLDVLAGSSVLSADTDGLRTYKNFASVLDFTGLTSQRNIYREDGFQFIGGNNSFVPLEVGGSNLLYYPRGENSFTFTYQPTGTDGPREAFNLSAVDLVGRDGQIQPSVVSFTGTRFDGTTVTLDEPAILAETSLLGFGNEATDPAFEDFNNLESVTVSWTGFAALHR